MSLKILFLVVLVALVAISIFWLTSHLTIRNDNVSDELKKYFEPTELEKLVKKIQSGEETNIVIVDVRPASFYKSSHIPTAINITNGIISPEHESLKTKKMALYCETGGRVEMAKKNMIKSGFDEKNMLNFGGFYRYKGAKEQESHK